MIRANIQVTATVQCRSCSARRTYAECPPDFFNVPSLLRFAESAAEYFNSFGWRYVAGVGEQFWECPAHAMLEKEAA